MKMVIGVLAALKMFLESLWACREWRQKAVNQERQRIVRGQIQTHLEITECLLHLLNKLVPFYDIS